MPTEINYLKLAAEASRETRTDQRIRAMDAYEIVTEIHEFEDRIEALEEQNRQLHRALERIRETLNTIAGFPEAAKGEDQNYVLGLELPARYARAAIEKDKAEAA